MFTKEQTNAIAGVLSESFCWRLNDADKVVVQSSEDQWNRVASELN